MPKDIPVSNGNLLFNFDSDYQIRDIYFPLIGQENHSKGHPFRLGLWVDGRFSWMGPEWKKDLRYHDDSLVTNVFLENKALGLKLQCADAVDVDVNVYIKKIEVTNSEDFEREVRIFFCHDFYLYGNDIGDTAYYDPRTRSLIHYKGLRYFFISCCLFEKWGVDYFNCGAKGEPGNPWFISTLWLGEYFIVRSENLQELYKAIPYLEWCTKKALPSGVLAEQVHPTNGSPLSVSPLTWSHSAFVWAVLQYTEKFKLFKK